ncbi:MAG: SPOR domain-containing protein [Proteobacteria bacterium]|nr:SPOR domain-containing protein [Pseudomonadota bacterium]
MDQKTPNGSDKRSWRERLGIGASRELPRISEEFKPVSNTPPQPEARAVARPAPMAPRTPTKAAPPIADKLQGQRDAAEKLAEQRAIAARQRTESKAAAEQPAVNGNGSGKPKFTFAEEPEAEKPAPVQARPQPPEAPKPEAAAAPLPPPKATTPLPPPPPPVVPGTSIRPSLGSTAKPLTPPLRTGGAPSIIPPRQPLGSSGPIMPPRGNFSQTTPPPPPRYNSGYVPPMPNYRSVDPNNRYAPPLKPTPPRSYTGGAGGYAGQPRLNVPPLPQAGGYGQQTDYGYGNDPSAGRAGLRVPPRGGQQGYRQDYGEGELFEDPRSGQRRATAGEYSQAYRDYEMGYDDDVGRSRGPLLWLLLLGLFALVALGGIWFYYNNIKPQMSGQQGANTPVVTAPAQPAKSQPDQQQGQQPASRKLIYDRIVGDREVLGGDVMQSEEPPVSPSDAAPQSGTGGEELTPLPLPPPPGDGTGDQQGSLTPTGKQDSAQIIPAAGESQAAGSPLYPPLPGEDVYAAPGKSQPPVPPVPGDGTPQVAALDGQKSDGGIPTPPAATSASGNANSAGAPSTADDVLTDNDSEAISDSSPAPAAKPKKAVVQSDDGEEDVAIVEKPKKVAQKKPKQPELGAEPVVLVPPAGGQSLAEETENSAFGSGSAGGGLYAGDGIVTPEASPPAQATPPATQKKRKTLADLFRGEQQSDATSSSSFDNAVTEPAPAKKQVQAEPQPVVQQQVASAGGFAVQLASFRTRDEASTEFRRLQAKHGVLGRLSPIISEAVVGGSTRYRLAAGTMPSREQASAVCAQLFAGGERDCLVRKL